MTPAELITGIVTEEGVLRGAVRGRPARGHRAARERWASMPGFRAIRPATRPDAGTTAAGAKPTDRRSRHRRPAAVAD